MRPEYVITSVDEVPFEFRLLPVPVAAKALGLGQSTVWREIAAGRIQAVHLCGTKVPGREVIRLTAAPTPAA